MSHYLRVDFLPLPADAVMCDRLANRRVGTYILNRFPNGALLRKHERPGLKMKDFVALCAKFGYKIDSSSSHAFNNSLLSVKDPGISVTMKRRSILPRSLLLLSLSLRVVGSLGVDADCNLLSRAALDAAGQVH